MDWNPQYICLYFCLLAGICRKVFKYLCIMEGILEGIGVLSLVMCKTFATISG